MRKVMKDEGERWRSASPHRAAWGAYLLADDFLYEKITKAADGAEKKTGLGRKALAYGIAGAGTAATCAVLAPEPLIAASFAPVGAMALFIFARMIRKATELRAAAGAIAQNAEALILRAARLPLLAVGAFKFAEAEMHGARGAAAYGIYFASLAVAAYLSGGGNGMMEKARSHVRELMDGAAHAMQPQEAVK